MRLAVLSTASRNAGGLFFSVRWLSKALAEQGCEPELFSPKDEFAAQDQPQWDPLPVHLFSAFGPLASCRGMRKALRDYAPDVIHAHGIWTDSQWAADQLSVKTGAPVVVSPRGMLDPWAVNNVAWKKKLVEKLFARGALERARCIHALCRSEADAARAYGLKNPIAVIPNGVELPSRVEKGPRSGPKKILFLGRVHPKKGLKELIEGWARINTDWKLLIAGWDDGGHAAGLQALANELVKNDSVEFLGPMHGEEKDALLREVDAFILPSFSEGLPMSVLEAWSYELPIVMTDFCNLPEGFAAGAAERVEPNVGSIAEGLDRFFGLSESERLGIGARGRALVENKFTWPKIAADTRSVYDWCLTGDNPPDCLEFY